LDDSLLQEKWEEYRQQTSPKHDHEILADAPGASDHFIAVKRLPTTYKFHYINTWTDNQAENACDRDSDNGREQRAFSPGF
jgi:hypothetical protein